MSLGLIVLLVADSDAVGPACAAASLHQTCDDLGPRRADTDACRSRASLDAASRPLGRPLRWRATPSSGTRRRSCGRDRRGRARPSRMPRAIAHRVLVDEADAGAARTPAGDALEPAAAAAGRRPVRRALSSAGGPDRPRRRHASATRRSSSAVDAERGARSSSARAVGPDAGGWGEQGERGGDRRASGSPSTCATCPSTRRACGARRRRGAGGGWRRARTDDVDGVVPVEPVEAVQAGRRAVRDGDHTARPARRPSPGVWNVTGAPPVDQHVRDGDRSVPSASRRRSTRRLTPSAAPAASRRRRAAGHQCEQCSHASPWASSASWETPDP